MFESGAQMSATSRTHRAYERELPGGGYVAIDVTQLSAAPGRESYMGTVILERRSSSREDDQTAPVIAEALGPSISAVLQQLFPLTQHNAAIAAAVLRRRRAAPGLCSLDRSATGVARVASSLR
jgi:hypothetical protein